MRNPPTGQRVAIAWMLVATLLFSGMNAVAKALGPRYSALQLIFFRNLFAFVPLGVALLASRQVAQLRTYRPLGHALRAASGLVSLACFFYAFARLPLATVTAVSFAAPFCVALLSWPLLGEPVGRRRFVGILVGFAGVLVIMQPTGARIEPAMGAAIAATILYALVMIFMRQLNRTEQPAAIVFYYLLSSVVLSGIALPFVWTEPDWTGWGLLFALGVFGGFAQLAMTIAFRHGDAALVAPFDYTSILWSTMIGGFAWHEWPGPGLWLGVVIVVASGLWLARTDRHRA
ncbi:MAG TPA: DMT family transporter [Candidatus Baltobacteraceae bacterium]|nr:DMT family transporter [Candidatus Baltobacteraceae bacterium]